MKKILIALLVILLLVLCITTVVNGIEIGNLKILSISQIEEKNNQIDNEIKEINNLIDTTYPSKLSELNKASTNLENAKKQYLKYASLSSDEEILAAMQEKSYKIEFLWAKLGTHARNEEVNLKFEITASYNGANNVNDLNFTVNGTYINIIDFIYAIENDPDLNFKIENFKLLPYDSNGILEATFTVKNIAIEGNTSSQTTDSTQSSGTNANTTNNNTNNSNKNANSQTQTTTTTTNNNSSATQSNSANVINNQTAQ